MDYYLSFSNNYVSFKEVKLDDEGYNVYQRYLNLGTYKGKYKIGSYRISRCDGWFTDDYTIKVGFGDKLSKFLSDIGYLRKFYYSSSFDDFIKKYPTVEKATSPNDTGFGPSPIFFNPNENVNVYDEYIQFEFELDKDYRNSHDKADKYALEVMRIAEKIVKEVVRMTPLDFSRFSFRPSKSGSSFRIPQWAGGITKIGLKAFANYLGANLPDFDFSGGGDSSFDFSVGDSDFDFDSDSDFSNIAFGHAPNDGTYTDSGNTVTVRSDSGVKYTNIHVFFHHGQKWLDFKDHWVQPSSSGYFKLNGVGYKVI